MSAWNEMKWNRRTRQSVDVDNSRYWFNIVAITYRVLLATDVNGDFRSRSSWIHEVANGDWRLVRITCVHSENVISFSHCHGTITRYVGFEARLCADVNLYTNAAESVTRPSSETTIFTRRLSWASKHLSAKNSSKLCYATHKLNVARRQRISSCQLAWRLLCWNYFRAA